MSNSYSPYQQPPSSGGYHPQPGPRYPTFQPGSQPRGPSPPQHLQQAQQQRPGGQQPQYQHIHPGMMQPNNIYTIHHPLQGIQMQYHLVGQQPGQQFQQPGQPGPRGPQPGPQQQQQQVQLTQNAPPFTPGQYGGGPVPGYPSHTHHQPGQQQPANIIYSHGGPHSLGHMAGQPGQPIMFQPQPHRFHMMNQQPQHQHPNSLPPQPGPPGHQGGIQPGPPQPPGHPAQPGQPGLYRPAAGPGQQGSGQQGPPPASTPPGAAPPPGPAPAPAQQSQPSTLKRRERKGIAIIDPTTRQEVTVAGSGERAGSTAPPAATPDSSRPPSTPAPDPQPVSPAEPAVAEDAPVPAPAPPGKQNVVAAEFAARVAAMAEGGKAETEEAQTESVTEKDEIVDVETVDEVASPAPATELEVTSSLSVTTDLAREDILYEPVSPTPLPDSPSEESGARQEAARPSPFEDVINRKAGAGRERQEPPPEDVATEPKGRRKKDSKAAKREKLNSKGEKKGDLLDVFAANEDTVDPTVLPAVTKKSPTPDPVPSKPKLEPTMSIAKPETAESTNQKSEQIEEKTVELAGKIQNLEITEPPVLEVTTAKEEVEPEAAAAELAQTDLSAPAAKINGDVHLAEVESESGNSVADDTLEDGEIREEEDSTDESKPKLKYNYQEDQWSPLNLDGKKQYGREFLICLQRDPLSLTRPENLPNMEIVKDKPNVLKQGGAAPRNFDFTPGFVVKSGSRGADRPGKRASQGGDRRDGRDGRDGGRGGPKPRMVITLPSSISAEVKLNKAENAWVPGVKDKKVDGDLDPETELRRKVLAILNKLCPTNFKVLVEKFQELPIDSQEKLSLCMEIVFEKAVDEPSFSVAYAEMCQVMQMKKVPIEGKEDEFVNFRKLLISRCQKEFEKDYMEGLDRNKYAQDMNEAKTEDDKKRIKAEFEAMEMKLRRRSLGNIRFIGELYKLNMLTSRIMHECIKRLLLNYKDEEALECLCRLLNTVGQALDQETLAKLQKGSAQGLNDLTVYFKEMRKLVDEKKTSSRVRFLLQDVIDLKVNGWKKRREDAGPKTIDQIHKEIEKEQLEQKLQQAVGGPPPPGRDRRDDRRDRDRDRDDHRRRSQKGGPGGGAGAAHPGDDSWQNVPTRVARAGYEKPDASRITKTANTRLDADSMSFGPPRPAAGLGTWGRGSQSAKTSRQEQSTQNRFASLDSDGGGGPPAGYDGRGSGGRFGGSRYGGRGSSQESDRAKAIALARDMGGNRSQSVMAPPPGQSRENSAQPRSSSMVSQPAKPASISEVPLNGPTEASRDDVEKWTTPLLNEYLHNVDLAEAIKEVGEKFSSATIPTLVEVIFNEVIERSDKARVNAGGLVASLLSKKMVTEQQFLDSLDASLLSIAEDLLVDIPKFWDFLAQLLAPVISSQVVPLTALKRAAEKAELGSGELGRRCAAGKLVAAVLHEMGKSGHSAVSHLWRQSGLKWEDFLAADTSVEQFVRDNRLEWTGEAGQTVQQEPELDTEGVANRLTAVLSENKSSNDAVFDWVDTHCKARLGSVGFVRLLTTVLMESVIDGVGGPTNQCKLNEGALQLREPVLKKYLDGGTTELEKQALVALQYLMHRLEHPNKLLHSIFEKLYDDDIISEEAFNLWEKNTDPSEQEGKGVALKSCTQFFTWLQEAEEEDED